MWIVLAAAAGYETATNWCRPQAHYATQNFHENKKRMGLMSKKKDALPFLVHL